ncbi:MAG: hypothetical protein GX271_04080 [Clostridiales bacterium]|nr:hypothetical protein [Clostridiales bacterium]
MAEDGLLHTADLLKTALPYVDAKSRLTLELLVKLYELIICMRNFTNNDISACGFDNDKADMEALLKNIRPKCNKDEQAFVDKMLNVFQAKRMFEMYNTYMGAMKAMEGFEGFGGGNTNGDNDSDGEADSYGTNSFFNNLKDFDFSSIFGDNFDSEEFMNNYNNMITDKVDSEEIIVENTYDSYLDDSKLVEEQDNTNSSNNDIANTNNNDKDMFEELKSMIPPDQMQTFENLRMLFGSMSYDDSKKPNENKE